MSDDEEEYEYDYGSDAEYEEGSEGEGEDEMIEIENSYYEGEDLIKDNPEGACELFDKVVQLETERDSTKWRFKALRHLVILYYKLHKFQQSIQSYRNMLVHMSTVTRNECTDAINAVLDVLLTSTDADVSSTMYEITLEALKSANNERLWFNTNQKLAKLYLDTKRFKDVEKIISTLKLSCQSEDGVDDQSKGSYLLEVYCLEIQLCSATQNSSRMRQIYPKTLNLNASVSDPRIMGVIREEGGKMRMTESNWDEAYNEFFEAFKAYQEAGNARARDCLKYVVLASMLALNDINIFAAREAKAFSEDREILAMSELRTSLDNNDLSRFEKTVKNKANRIMEEPFLMTYIQPLRRRMKEQVLLHLTKPYKKVLLSFLAKELSLDVGEVEMMIVDMILEGRLDARIDQINGFMELGKPEASLEVKRMQALSKWADALTGYSESFYSKLCN